MADTFYERPIVNSPYAKPQFHHPLDDQGQPLGLPPIEGRRPSRFLVPVPQTRRRAGAGQTALPLEAYSNSAIINEIRGHVDAWRDLPGGADWGVTPTTQRLLEHWRGDNFSNQKPFFCQIEAVETLIWLTEVARGRRQYGHLWRAIEAANAEANPELIRLALKMATGAGKTTVMAMIIAWQTLNAVRAPGSDRFSRAFLIMAPGITIRDRLRVLYPEHPENYYQTREIVPRDMLGDIAKATIVIANYHAFQYRETLQLSRTGRAFLEGNDARRGGAAIDRGAGRLGRRCAGGERGPVFRDRAAPAGRGRPGRCCNTPAAGACRKRRPRRHRSPIPTPIPTRSAASASSSMRRSCSRH